VAKEPSELTRDEIGEVWKAFSAAPITLVGITSLMPPALDIALDSGCAVYDALYLALAEAREAKLVTADGKLVRTLEGSSFANSVVAL
jgi:predicted nucleic acid-binding protein